ncbi:hypothetical protein BB558_002809 [Smittium angustum]|uniref:ornithine carbamoyltransferase n=1 Tax=Smittium angustum TaxID=133377 RepID=A0A2U1J7J6_SMIAN|nr:hypothetical protein BB558_002809 [Smittium angustum]
MNYIKNILPKANSYPLLAKATRNGSKSFSTFYPVKSNSFNQQNLLPKTSKPVKHMLTLEDYTPAEIFALVEKAHLFKRVSKATDLTEKEKLFKQNVASKMPLKGKTMALMFSKRSTRTRISTESSVAYLGGHAMFLGSQDIQLGVNESLLDSSKVISSMVDGIMSRVNRHEDVLELSKYSKVPVINVLSDTNHPTEIIADILTMFEIFGKSGQTVEQAVKGLNVCWIGDSNNILYELIGAFPKCGINMKVSTPAKYPIPQPRLEKAKQEGLVDVVGSPSEAISGSDIIITDTWISMGQESEKKQKLIDFAGYQITRELIEKSKPSEKWIFMHCLPRKPEEVDDKVFYSNRSVVFQEAENRKWAVLSTIHSLLVEN